MSLNVTRPRRSVHVCLSHKLFAVHSVHAASAGVLLLERRCVPAWPLSDAAHTFLQAQRMMACVCAPGSHCYHLQCVMQWAQRSRECPLCFRALQLQACTRLRSVAC